MRDKGEAFCVGLFIGTLLALFCLIASNASRNSAWKRELVNRGHATWEVAPDGSTTFKWKESEGQHD